MGRHPAAILPLVTAGLAALPGCLVVPSTPADQPPARAPVAARTASGHRFGEYAAITGPGQHIPLNPTATAQATPAVPIADPPPPPVAPAGGAVQPPAPDGPRIALSPPPADPPLVAAVRAYLDNRPDLAVEHLRGFEPANQELLIRLLPAVAHARHAKLRDPAEAGVLSAQVGAAAEAVARVAPLRVKKACFVWQVKQFGVYDPVPAEHPGFLPGGLAVLYAEVENAPSDPTPHPAGGDGFVTRLACGLQILDAAGKPAAPFDEAAAKALPVADYTRSQLRDVFLRLEFQVPKRPGAYTLVFEVRDPATGRAVRKPVEFRVAGQQ